MMLFGKLEINQTMTELAQICQDADITILPIKTSYLDKLETLPEIYGDPFDRYQLNTLRQVAGYLSLVAVAKYKQACIWLVASQE